MKVEVLKDSADPISTISIAAGTCYGKSDISIKRLENCMRAGHMGVFEHAYVTFSVKGISRACSHQLVRHRLASFCQESQRYCKVNVNDDSWYVTPPDILEDDNKRSMYDLMMAKNAANYKIALETLECKPEDARYLLPEATKTNLVMTVNCRELFHILDLRQSNRAQWEIRYLADEMELKLVGLPKWRPLLRIRLAAKSEEGK